MIDGLRALEQPRGLCHLIFTDTRGLVRHELPDCLLDYIER